jgi:integrase
MTKRINGEGLVRKHPTRDLYEARYSHVDSETGKRKVSSVYGKTAQEALDSLRVAQSRIAGHQPARDSRRTVASWVEEWCAGNLFVSSRKQTTQELYRSLANSHLASGEFGARELAKLRPSHIQLLLHTFQDRGMAPSTVRNIYAVLNAVLEDARIDKLIAVNPMREVRRPASVPVEAKHLTPAEVRVLLKSAEGLRYKTALDLLASTGLRRGEALALAWADIDLNGGTLKVTKTVSRIRRELVATTPKTAKSRREVPLSPGVIAMLRGHRKAQVAERLQAGDVWQDRDLVFATEHGGYVDPRNLLRALKTAGVKAGIGGIGLHTLRHSAATAMLEANVPIHVVSRILGHSSIAVTIDLYGHVNDESKREAIDGLSEAMGL